jgi:hypothetical protein
VTQATHEPPMRRPARLRAAWVLLLAGWAGCAAFDKGQTLVPTKYQLRAGPFLVFSHTQVAEDAPPIRCLQSLERDIGQALSLRTPSGEDPVEVYILNDRQDFDHFLKYYYPELPSRRAFFIAKGSQRIVYTYVSPRLEEDLRHEATHALLRGALGDLPLWLDEGLAEYFETDLSRPDAERSRLELIAADLKNRWSPNLERLESMTDISQMSQRDYREAWSWVHLCLNGSGPGKSILMSYLGQTDRAESKVRLRPRLAEAQINEAVLLAHLNGLRSGPVASTPPRDPGSVRFQDQPVEPAASIPPRGLVRRLGAWLGL